MLKVSAKRTNYGATSCLQSPTWCAYIVTNGMWSNIQYFKE